MAITQLFYIGTSKKKEIRHSGAVISYDWGDYGEWTNVEEPVEESVVNVKYNKTTKDTPTGATFVGDGGVTYCGTEIPATAPRMIDGVETTVPVRFYKRGYTVYTRTSSLKKKKKMARTIYSDYQYQLQYKDKVITETEYSEYVDGTNYIYFSDHYYDDSGTRITTTGHMLHPQTYSLSYSDVRKNFNIESNNNDSRDNTGMYMLSNVRPNIVSLSLGWQGLSAEDGADLLDTLNPSMGQDYLVVQYLDPATNKHKNGTFYVSDRKVSVYPGGIFKEITVELTEV